MTDEFDRSIFISETGPGPPAGRPRWYCYEHEPGFDTPEEGVVWALTQTDVVMVRPLYGPVFWAGTKPREWDEREEPFRPWPPSREDREEIDANYQRKVERIAEVNRMAPRLAEAIADRVAKVLPEPWSVKAATGEEPSVLILREGREVYEGGIGDFEIWELYEEILSGVQDEISEETTDAWPHNPTRGMHMWMPEVEVADNEIRAWFGPKDDPVLVLEPIQLVELRR